MKLEEISSSFYILRDQNIGEDVGKLEGLNDTEGKMEKPKFNEGTTLELDWVKISRFYSLTCNVTYIDRQIGAVLM